jgi:pimeloyl-ACP methyl ester carboxylesterase
MIPRFDFGGQGEMIHFAHANAYPPGCYRQFMNQLTPHFQVVGLQQRPLWPHTNPQEMTDWRLFAGDLIRFMDQEGLRQVIGMGHSLGAVATMMAAIARPDLFKALVMIEPVFLPPHILELSAANPEAMAFLPLVQSAQRRRTRWQSREAAFTRFRGKAVFARFSDEALWDYVNHATWIDEATGEAVLAFPREWEAQIYAHPPLTVWEDVTKVTQPVLAVRGAETDTITVEAWQLWQEKCPEATFVELPDTGHMIPMERPSALAEVVLSFCREVAG